MTERPEIRSVQHWYERYLRTCNEHRFAELGEFVAEDVQVNGEAAGLTGYVAGLTAVVRSFADYRWELQRLLVDGNWLAAHLIDSGTHTGVHLGIEPSGRAVRTQEFAHYRRRDGLIVAVWVAADDWSVVQQLSR